MTFRNVRIVNSSGENGGEFHVDPADAKRIEYVRRELASYTREEPSAGWRLETRGEFTGWHRWEAADTRAADAQLATHT